MTTNIVFVQDLALWVPPNVVIAAWLWARTPRGYLLGGASVVMAAIESTSIAVDQWYGPAADPGSTVASAALVPVFAGLALISPAAAWLLRGLAAAGRSRRWDRRHLPFGRKFPIVRTEGGFASDRSS
jgi:hypothetical protein